jgi:adenylate cyclase
MTAAPNTPSLRNTVSNWSIDMAEVRPAASPSNGGPASAPEMVKSSRAKRERLGELLVGNKVISLDQLDQALANQKESARLLGQTVVQLGYASEPDVLQIINRHYNVSLTDLSQKFGKEEGSLARLVDRAMHMRVSIKAKLSIAMIASLLLTILILSVVTLYRQRENLYQQTIKTGKVTLFYVANSAKNPLLDNKVLDLNQLIKEAAKTEGILYAAIVDRDGFIKAHTNADLIGKKMDMPSKPKDVTQDQNFSYFRFTNEKHRQVLNMTAPVAFGDKVLGSVDVGVSLDFISDQIRNESLAILLISVLIIALGVVISFFVGIGFARPISKLVIATREIGQGNLKYRLELDRNDELGDLASSFNFMSAELWKKQLMQESFGKYVGSDIVQMILANPESSWLKGTRSVATVLFTDIRGFTSFSESREPEQVVEALNDYFEIATRIIIDHGGIVDKFIGDAVMGVFGVPVVSENHAEQAVRASLVMQKQFKEQAKRTGNEILAKVGVGINTGPLVSGNLGSQVKMEYTVIGDAVNTASRLNNLAASGETVVSKSTLDPIKHLVKFEEMEPQKVKGKSEPVQVFKILSIKEPVAHVQAQNPAQQPSA